MGQVCQFCDNDGVKCSIKGTVYQATCVTCQSSMGMLEGSSTEDELQAADIQESVMEADSNTVREEDEIKLVLSDPETADIKLGDDTVRFASALTGPDVDTSLVGGSECTTGVDSTDTSMNITSTEAQSLRKISSKYIGESSRPIRMRVKEHFSNLSNLRTDSFMVEHWMNCHGNSMTPPVFKFEIKASYRDSMSRQLAEALLIEKEGNLNRRTEYGSNHLCRFELNVPEWERERIMEVQAREKANRTSNLKCFVSVIHNASWSSAV